MDIRTVTNHNTPLFEARGQSRDEIKQKQSNDQILNPTFPSLAVIRASLKELTGPAAHYWRNPQSAGPLQERVSRCSLTSSLTESH